MILEISVFKNCLCCLPLRQGLLVWGYLKLIALVTFIPFVWLGIQFSLFDGIQMFILAASTFVAAIELIFQVFLICGVHSKNYKLLIAYNCYNILFICLICFLFCLTLIGWISAESHISRDENAFYVDLFVAEFTLAIAYLYLVILVWVEVKRMKYESNQSNGSYNRFDYEAKYVKEEEGN